MSHSKSILRQGLELLSIMGVGIVLFGHQSAFAQSPSQYGVWSFREAYLGASSLCGPGEVELTIKLLDYNTSNEITNTSGVSIQHHVAPSSDPSLIVSSSLYTYSSAVPICIDHDDFVAVDVFTTGASIYESFESDMTALASAVERDSEIGGSFEVRIYLKQKGDSPTMTAVQPHDSIFNTDPQFEYVLSDIPTQIGVTGQDAVYLSVLDVGTNTMYNTSLAVSGGAGYYYLPPQGLPDGYYEWGTTVSFDGVFTTPYGQDYLQIPDTGYFNVDVPTFILDQTAPTSIVSHSAVSDTAAGIDFEFQNIAQDTLSGLAQVVLWISDVGNGTSGFQTYPFTVGAGIVGGPTTQQTVTFSASLEYDSTYEYWFETTDAAGNINTSGVTTITTPSSLYPIINLTATHNGTVYPADSVITIIDGEQVTTSWTTVNATTCAGPNIPYSYPGTSGTDLNLSEPALGSSITYTLNCHGLAVASDLSASFTVTTLGAPNLTTPSIIDVNPTSFNAWSAIYGSLTVTFLTENDGDGPIISPIPSAAARLDMYSDGTVDDTDTTALSALNVNGSVTRTVSFTNVPVGDHRLEIEVDDGNDISELDETDNIRVITVSLPPYATPTITSSKEVVRPGETVEISWDTHSTFSMDCVVAGPGLTTVSFNPNVDGTLGSQTTSALTQTSEYTITCTETAGYPTPFLFEDSVVVESTGTVKEF